MSSHQDVSTALATRAEPKIQIWHFIVLIVLYLGLVQGTTALLTAGGEQEYAAPSSVDYLVRMMVIPVGLGIILLTVVMAFLGNWQRVFVDTYPLHRWTIAIPLIILVTVLIVMNYSGLASMGLAFALMLLVATFMIGFGEELLFRGIGLESFRSAGFSEFQVGLWSSIVFGVVHFSNVFITGVQASLLQVVLTTATGFLFYLVMRATGSLVAAMIAHGLWDFAVISTQVPQSPTSMAPVAFGVLVVILVLVFIRRKHLAPAQGKSALN